MNCAAEDLEYLLQRTYLQGRAHSSNLLNRENALASSTAAQLSKTSSDAVESQRKVIELGRSMLDALDSQDRSEEHELTVDALCRLEEEFALMLAKHHKLPAVTNSRFSSRPESNEIDEIEAQLAGFLSAETDSAVASADALFVQMHDEYLKSIGKDPELMDCDDEVSELTLRVNSHSMNSMNPANSTASNFMTAKQALAKSSNNRTSPPAASPGTGNGYNPAAQMRRLGLGNKRPRPALEQAHRSADEGRDINTEFR
jgi:hypothetical protein